MTKIVFLYDFEIYRLYEKIETHRNIENIAICGNLTAKDTKKTQRAQSCTVLTHRNIENIVICGNLTAKDL